MRRTYKKPRTLKTSIRGASPVVHPTPVAGANMTTPQTGNELPPTAATPCDTPEGNLEKFPFGLPFHRMILALYNANKDGDFTDGVQP